MPTRDEWVNALKNAHAQGKTDDARRIAAIINALPTEQAQVLPDIDSTPVNIIPKTLVGKGGEKRTLNKEEVDFGLKGIAKDNPGDGPISWEDYANIAQYSAGQDYSARYLANKLKSAYQLPNSFDSSKLTRVQDGKIQYLDLKSRRWKYLDESMFDSFASPGTAARFIGEIGTDLVAGGGAALAGSAASPAVGLVAGAGATGANTAAWRLANLKKGRDLGINEGLDDADLQQLAAGRGLQSAGFAAAAGVVPAWKVAGKKVDAGLFDKNSANYADDVRKGLETSVDVIDDINRIHGEAGPQQEQFNPSLAQRSGVQDVQNVEADLRAGHASRRTAQISGEIQARDNANKRVLRNVWDYLFPYDPIKAAGRRGAGLDVTAEAQDLMRSNPLVRASKEEARLLREQSKVVAGIDETVRAEDVLDAVRGSPSPNGHLSGTKFYELHDKLTSRRNALAEEVFKRSRRNGKPVEIDFTKTGLDNELYKLLASAHSGTGALPRSEFAGVIRRLTGVLQKRGGSITWDQFDSDYQQIGRMIENRLRGTMPSSDNMVTVSQLEELRGIYEKALMLKDNTGPNGLADLIETWQERKQTTSLIHDIFDSKVVRGVMKSENPENVLPESFMRDLFPAEGAEYLRVLVGHVKGDPEAMSGLRSYLLKQYKKEILDPRTGRPNMDAHVRWMVNHKEQMDLLFDGKAPPVARVGELENAITAANERGAAEARRIKNAWYEVVDRKYKNNNLGVDDIFSRVTNLQMTQEQLGQMATHLSKISPETLDMLQRQAINLHAIQLKGAKELPSSSRLMSWIESDKGKKFLALMSVGKRNTYEQDVRALAAALKITESKGVARGAPTQNIASELWRIGAGPLSRMNRFMTGARRFSAWADATRAYEVISDPERLHQALMYGTGGGVAKMQDNIPTAVAMDIGAMWAFFQSNDND